MASAATRGRELAAAPGLDHESRSTSYDHSRSGRRDSGRLTREGLLAGRTGWPPALLSNWSPRRVQGGRRSGVPCDMSMHRDEPPARFVFRFDQVDRPVAGRRISARYAIPRTRHQAQVDAYDRRRSAPTNRAKVAFDALRIADCALPAECGCQRSGRLQSTNSRPH